MLRNRLVDTKSPAFITLETEPQLYRRSLDSLRNKLKYATSPDYEGILNDLKSLDASADACTAAYIEIREQMRQAKQWQLADEIRAEQGKLGITLEDTPRGTVRKYNP